MQEIIRNNPFVRLVFPFILGVCSGSLFSALDETFLFYALIIAFSALTLLSLFYKIRFFKPTINFFLIFIFYVLGLYQFQREQYEPVEFKNQEVIVGQVIDYPDSTKSALKVNVKLIEKITDSLNTELRGNAIAYLRPSDKAKELMPGTYITLKVRPQQITNMGNPYEFDYKSWAANNHYYYSFFLKESDWFIIGQSTDFSLIFTLKKLRRNLLNHYKRVGISNDELSVFSALTLGDKSMLEGDLRKGFAAAGLMHVLAVSGLHVGIIYLVVRLICSALLKIKYGRFLRFIISIIVLWGYATLTGLSPSVTRAATMFSVFVLGDLFGRRYAVYNSIALAAFVLLFYDPHLIMNVGFQMSFLAVFGIVAFYPIVYKWIFVPNKLIDKLWQLIAVSIAAQLITTPLSLYYFNQFPLFFLLSNILMIPLVTVLMYLFIVFIITIPIPVISSKIGWCISSLTEVMNSFAQWVNSIDWAVYKVADVTIYHVVMLYGLLGIVTYFGFRTNYKFLKLTFIFLIVYVGFDVVRNYQFQNLNRFVVFNSYNQPLWFLSSGNRYTIGSPNQDLQSARYVQPILQAYNINQKVNCDRDEKIDISFFGKGDYTGIFYNLDYFPNSDTLHCRWLILSENTPGDILKLISKVNATFLIADATVPDYKLADWRKVLKNTNKKIHSVTENGAFF
ncbi:MAG: hypothetical protein C0599_08320 [Salinivirgaceae bacterium]|nr:MAG: hypothetical protein C0599_08320 [Salinivirgaceae bacterium]